MRHRGQVALGGDGQVTIGATVVKASAKKVRKLHHDGVLAGFAGTAADAFTLFARFEAKLDAARGNLPRAAVEVYESAERTLTLLNDLLDLSRLDASRLQPIVRESDARHIIREAVQAVLPAAEARRIRIETRPADGVLTCRTDPLRLRQIIINLLTNAVRHSPESKAVAIEVRDSDARIRIDVVDQGDGLTAEQQAVIFDAFMRAGSENERGTGLGLTLSRQLARLLGGDLRLESQAGAGARFILEIARFLS